MIALDGDDPAPEGVHLLVRPEQDADPVDWAAAVTALRPAPTAAT
ncbi:hypothetical protein [Thermocatellispora tengchongensis]